MNTSGSKSPHSLVAGHLASVPRSGIRDFFDIVSTMQDVISLGIGEPDFDTPWHIREAAMYALERGATGYTSNLGLAKLRRGLADYVERTFDASYDPATEILVTVGVSEALDLVLRAIINPGDEILYHEPSYVSYGPVITFAHGVPVVVPTTADTGFKLTAEAVEQKVTARTKALLLNYPNNPTGAKLERAEVEALADCARRHDLLVIADEIYGELTYEGRHVSLASLPGMKERTVFLHGFSKAWAMTGFRMGYACAPAPLVEAMMKIHQYTMLCAPILSQEAAIEALVHAEEDIEIMRNEYRKHGRFMHASLEEMGLPCSNPDGAFYAFPRMSSLGMSAKDFAIKLLNEEKVAVVPGSAFGAVGEGHIRCSFATGLDDIKEAMQRMASFVARHR
jgi:aminotransferase